MVLAAAHQDQECHLETFTMGAGLVLVIGLASSAEIEVPGLEGGPAVSDIDGALTVAALETDIAQTFFGIVGAEAQSFVDDLGVATGGLLFSYDAKVLLGKVEGPDYAVSPG
jgi:hypothetical protein